MADFVALTWIAGSDAASAAADIGGRLRRGKWRCLAAGETFALWAAPGAPVRPSPSGQGWIVGRIARRGSAEDLPPASPGELRLGPSEAALALSRLGFGGYVAIWPRTEAAELSLYRDPSGAQEVFCGSRDGLTWAASAPDEVEAMRGRVRGVRWGRLAGMLIDPGEVAAGSALEGVEAPAPGELLTLGLGGERRRLVWSPAERASHPLASAIPDDGELAELRRGLRDAVTMAVRFALEGEARWLVEVSGGLDSAIVAALAKGCAGDRVAAWPHYVGRDPEADERRYADAVATHHDLELDLIAKAEVALTEADLTAVGEGVRPCLHGLDPDYDAGLRRLAQTRQATALLTGQGGDTVFWTLRTPLVAAPLAAGGRRRALFDPRVRRLALWSRRSVPALLLALGKPVRADAGTRSRLLHPDLRHAPAPRTHPWLRDLNDVEPARRLHIEELARCQILVGRTSRSAFVREVHPLLSQPVLEASLRTPPLALLEGERDRGLARSAFAERLPERVRRRRGKGDLTAYYSRMLARSAPLLRPYLLDGCLVKQDLLDRSAAEQALEGDSLMLKGGAPELMETLAFEAWVRRWS